MLSSNRMPLRSLLSPETDPFVMKTFSTSGKNLHCSGLLLTENKRQGSIIIYCYGDNIPNSSTADSQICYHLFKVKHDTTV